MPRLSTIVPPLPVVAHFPTVLTLEKSHRLGRCRRSGLCLTLPLRRQWRSKARLSQSWTRTRTRICHRRVTALLRRLSTGFIHVRILVLALVRIPVLVPVLVLLLVHDISTVDHVPFLYDLVLVHVLVHAHLPHGFYKGVIFRLVRVGLAVKGHGRCFGFSGWPFEECWWPVRVVVSVIVGGIGGCRHGWVGVCLCEEDLWKWSVVWWLWLRIYSPCCSVSPFLSFFRGFLVDTLPFLILSLVSGRCYASLPSSIPTRGSIIPHSHRGKLPHTSRAVLGWGRLFPKRPEVNAFFVRCFLLL